MLSVYSVVCLSVHTTLSSVCRYTRVDFQYDCILSRLSVCLSVCPHNSVVCMFMCTRADFQYVRILSRLSVCLYVHIDILDLYSLRRRQRLLDERRRRQLSLEHPAGQHLHMGWYVNFDVVSILHRLSLCLFVCIDKLYVDTHEQIFYMFVYSVVCLSIRSEKV